MSPISQTQRDMLKRLGQFARSTTWFTTSQNGYQGLTETVALRNLESLEQAGFVRQARAGWALTQAARDWLDGAGKTVECAKVTNASSRTTYTPPAWTPARAEADDHKRHGSLEYAPQIERAT